MSAIDERFAQLRAAGRKALIPFLTAGDPSLAATAQALETLDACDCAMAEIGIPYSDPIADGPVIQASYTRSLDAGIKLSQILATLADVAPRLRMPLITMVSYSIIHRVGAERYLDQAQASGVSGAIVPDLLVEEGDALRALCRERDFSLIHLVTPTTPPERMLKIAERSTGFLYFVSVTGITGERRELPVDLCDKVAWLRERTELPICIGFGISTADHARQLAPVADGLIVGSALVRRLAADGPTDQALTQIRGLVTEIHQAMQPAAAK